MDSQKMAGESGLPPRSLLVPLGLAVVIAFGAASFFFLRFHYTLGGVNLYTYPNNNAGNMFGVARSFITGNARPPDATAYGGLATGLG